MPEASEHDALVADLLQWIARDERSYADVMDTWRTSCPRLPVWEEANDRGFVIRARIDGRAVVRITPSGANFLRKRASGNPDARPAS